MTRRISHDKLATLGGKEPVRDINRDALLALCRQAIDQQRQIQLASLGFRFFDSASIADS
jgi:hypothetical protein